MLPIVCFQRSRASMYKEPLTHSLLCSEFVELTLFISLSKKNVDGNVTYETPSMIDLDPSLSFADLNNIIGGIRAMDFDGDGYNDLIIPYYCGYKNNFGEESLFSESLIFGKI